MHSPQNPITRRAYLVRPRPGLVELLLSRGKTELSASLAEQPTVVMTEALLYEGKLEGNRQRILAECIEAFMSDLDSQLELPDGELRTLIFGPADIGPKGRRAIFESWWETVEVGILEIQTTW